MEPARSIIAKCGGREAVAQACGRSASSVWKWMVSKEKRGTGGLVPSECQVQLLLASRENDWGLTPADFFPPEVLAPADADAPVAEAEGTIALMALANGGCREEARRELVDIRNAVDAAILDLDAHDEAVATAPLRGVVK